MSIFENYQPATVLKYFEELCSIPHGSNHCCQVAEWLVSFAVNHGLKNIRDSADNVIIFKSASLGYESAESIILQAHTDMVCEKLQDIKFDFTKDSLKLAIDGDFVKATGTTLGADDGIGVAMILAVLSDKNLSHPDIEAVFTSDEEIGMIGAAALDASVLKSKKMINLDCEDEGVFYVGCAGGNVTKNTLPINREAYHGSYIKITVTGLNGGHSGVDIDKGRANSNVLITRLLAVVNKEVDMRIVSVNGGNKDNAIACHSEAIIAVDDENAFGRIFSKFADDIKSEYKSTEKTLNLFYENSEASLPMDKESTQKVLCLLSLSPDGIQAMSNDIPGLVETSLNLGILTTSRDEIALSHCVRSGIESQKNMLVDRLSLLSSFIGGSTEISGDYPAWEYNPASKLRILASDVYKSLYNKDPHIATIHAGLECGTLSSKISGLDCISIGPTISDVHTPRERFHISSLERTWKMLVEILKNLK